MHQMKWIDRIGVTVFVIAAILFFGPWLLEMFFEIRHDVPYSQDPNNIVGVELLDVSEKETTILKTLTKEEQFRFLNDLTAAGARKYANDPPTRFFGRTIRIVYADGGYDMMGQIMACYSADGSQLPLKGLYYISGKTREALFRDYLS